MLTVSLITSHCVSFLWRITVVYKKLLETKDSKTHALSVRYCIEFGSVSVGNSRVWRG